jgi:WD40 repeat protein
LEFANELFLFNDYLIISCGTDNKIKIWDALTGQLLNTLIDHTNWINSVAFSPDGLKIISGSSDCSVKIWDTQSGQLLNTLNSHRNAVSSVAYSFDNSRIASSSHDHSVKIWDAHTGQLLNTLVGHTDIIFSVAFSFDSSRIASGSRNHSIKIWDAYSGQLLNTLIDLGITPVLGRHKSHNSAVFNVAYSPDNLKIISGNEDSRIKIWDAQSGQLLDTLIDPGIINYGSHASSVLSVAFSFDNLRIVSGGSYDNIIKIWNASPLKGNVVQTGQLIRTLDGHTDWVNSVAFSPDNLRIVSGGRDGYIKIWDALSGQLLNTLDDHTIGINSVAFSNLVTYPIDVKLKEYIDELK